jgi:hypothetical protein
MTHLEPEEKIILAGDMSTHPGFCLWSTFVGAIASMHYDFGSKSAHRHATDAERMDLVTAKVIEFVEQHVDGVDDAIFEQPTPNSNRGLQTQIEMIAAFKRAANHFGAKLSKHVDDRCYPSSLKKWAAGHGAAEKWQMVAAANELVADAGYAWPIVDDNEADAVCLAAWYAERVKDRELRRLARKMQRETEASKA